MAVQTKALKRPSPLAGMGDARNFILRNGLDEEERFPRKYPAFA
jgi:hypothetical protein